MTGKGPADWPKPTTATTWRGRITKTIFWSLVTSYYDESASARFGNHAGLHSLVRTLRSAAGRLGNRSHDPIRSTRLEISRRRCGMIGRGSYVTLKVPNGDDYSLIIEIVDEPEPQTAIIRLAGGLSQGAVHVGGRTRRNSSGVSTISSPWMEPSVSDWMGAPSIR